MKKIEFFFKNLLLKILLNINPVKKQNSHPIINSNSKLLFIRLNRIGDALVTTPLLYEVKKQIGCKVYVLADKRNNFVFKNNPYIDEVILFNKRLIDFFSINDLIKDYSIDAIIDLHDDVSTTVSFLVALSKVKYKIALEKYNHNLYTHTISRPDPSTHHVIERILKLSDIFNIQIERNNVAVKYFPTDYEIEIAKEQIKGMNPEGKYLLGINISAGSEARFWGEGNYRELISLINHYDLKIILFCAVKDINHAKNIINESNIFPVTDSFGIFSAAILTLDFLISPDTSIVHIASINKIPVFGLYVKYNTRDMIWSPYNTKFECIITEEATLNKVTFSEVKNKLIPFLESNLNVKRNS